MDRKARLLEMRKQGTLKGKKPVFVVLKFNDGKIYNDDTAEFVMSFKDNIIYFQRLSTFSKALQPTKDFEINVKRFCEYDFKRTNFFATITLFDKKDFFLDINIQTETRDYFETENDISRLINYFETMGIVKKKKAKASNELVEIKPKKRNIGKFILTVLLIGFFGSCNTKD